MEQLSNLKHLSSRRLFKISIAEFLVSFGNSFRASERANAIFPRNFIPYPIYWEKIFYFG
jgi:hypothetical protein